MVAALPEEIGLVRAFSAGGDEGNRINIDVTYQSPCPGRGSRRKSSRNFNTNAPLATLYDVGFVVVS